MTRDESLEALLLVQYVALIVGSLVLARLGHIGLAHEVPSLKPPVAPGDYAHLLVVFLPIWVFAAERLGIHRVRVLTGPRTELARRLILTQAWGLAAVALILVAAQTPLNRSLIAIFFLLSTAVLLAASSYQRRFVARRRGESLVLVIGEADDVALGEIERARGRRVARCTFSGPSELAEKLRADPVDEVVLSEALSVGRHARARRADVRARHPGAGPARPRRRRISTAAGGAGRPRAVPGLSATPPQRAVADRQGDLRSAAGRAAAGDPRAAAPPAGARGPDLRGEPAPLRPAARRSLRPRRSRC